MTIQSLAKPEAKTRPDAWWRGASLYHIYPRSFADSNGDGVGDLAGVTAHLDYVADLGVDGVWLSPFFTSPMRDFGYDISDFCGVDPIFGDLEDFDRLLARAHQLGLKVIIDQVYSHTSDAHGWFRESRVDRTNPRADWYVWAEAKADGSPPSNWQSVFGGPAWTWDARRGQYYLHNFLSSQPDLNVRNPQVQEALLQTARFWLERGVDGFRLDAINFSMHDTALRDNPPAPADGGKRTRPFDFQDHIHNQSQPEIPGFLARIRELLDSYGGRFTVAEVGGRHAIREMKLFTQGQDRLNSAYGFDFLYAERLTPDLVRQALAQWPGEPGEGWPSWAFSNHDAPRAVSRWTTPDQRDAFARLTLLLLISLRGNIFLYQGEELGLPQSEVPFERLQDPEAIANWPLTLGRDGARTPMPWTAEAAHAGFSTVEPWLPVDPAHRRIAVDRQRADAGSVLNLARRLLAFRRDHAALRTGGIETLNLPGNLLGFERIESDERLVCVFNLGPIETTWSPPAGLTILESVGVELERPDRLGAFSGLIARRA